MLIFSCVAGRCIPPSPFCSRSRVGLLEQPFYVPRLCRAGLRPLLLAGSRIWRLRRIAEPFRSRTTSPCSYQSKALGIMVGIMSCMALILYGPSVKGLGIMTPRLPIVSFRRRSPSSSAPSVIAYVIISGSCHSDHQGFSGGNPLDGLHKLFIITAGSSPCLNRFKAVHAEKLVPRAGPGDFLSVNGAGRRDRLLLVAQNFSVV